MSIIENKMVKDAIKILISTIISISLIILVSYGYKVKNKTDQSFKISLEKSNRSNYPKSETVWAILEIPSVKIKTNVYRGESNDLLNYGALHHRETYFPKDGGTILIAGNNIEFKNLSKVKSNDDVVLRTLYGTYKYKVEKTRIKNAEVFGNDLEVRNDEEKLILYAPYPETSGYKSDRFVVYAK